MVRFSFLLAFAESAFIGWVASTTSPLETKFWSERLGYPDLAYSAAGPGLESHYSQRGTRGVLSDVMRSSNEESDNRFTPLKTRRHSHPSGYSNHHHKHNLVTDEETEQHIGHKYVVKDQPQRIIINEDPDVDDSREEDYSPARVVYHIPSESGSTDGHASKHTARSKFQPPVNFVFKENPNVKIIHYGDSEEAGSRHPHMMREGANDQSGGAHHTSPTPGPVEPEEATSVPEVPVPPESLGWPDMEAKPPVWFSPEPFPERRKLYFMVMTPFEPLSLKERMKRDVTKLFPIPGCSSRRNVRAKRDVRRLLYQRSNAKNETGNKSQRRIYNES